MDPACGVVIGGLLARRGVRKGSLSASGGVAAFVVAVMTWGSGIEFGVTLIAFYQTGSWLTRLGAKRKMKLDANNSEHGNRDAFQVLSCSLVGAFISLAHRVEVGPAPATLRAAFVGFYACCAGDTWASEIGPLFASTPRLITQPWKKVPAGTNGGVTLEGLLASAAGGAFVGFVFGLLAKVGNLTTYALLGCVTGIIGSLLDSVLGATIQITRYDDSLEQISATTKGKRICGYDLVSNHTVNFLSAATTALIAPFIF